MAREEVLTGCQVAEVDILGPLRWQGGPSTSRGPVDRTRPHTPLVTSAGRSFQITAKTRPLTRQTQPQSPTDISHQPSCPYLMTSTRFSREKAGVLVSVRVSDGATFDPEIHGPLALGVHTAHIQHTSGHLAKTPNLPQHLTTRIPAPKFTPESQRQKLPLTYKYCTKI